MTNNQSSMTALMSAFGRAYHSINDEPKIFNDFLARKILSDDEYAQMSGHMTSGIRFFNPEHANELIEKGEALKWVVQNQIAPISLSRSRYCEDMIDNAIMLGVEQYVILGAGFDTFALRKKQYSQRINVFEVDHPATQNFKIEKLDNSELEIPDNLFFVPVNFSSDDLSEKIRQCPRFNCMKRSFFSWLGVTYYLTKEEILKTLKSIALIIPEGSAIVLDYADENLFDASKTTKRVQNMLAMAAASGEPMKSCFKYSELESLLEEAGFLIYEHVSPTDIEKRYFTDREDYFHAFENINFVLAVHK